MKAYGLHDPFPARPDDPDERPAITQHGGPRLTLIDAPRCPYCARVRIALAEKGVAYETIVIDLDDRPDWLYEKNPIGRVPVIEEDGWVLPESAVINEYLEETHPEPPLLPADPEARAAARLRIFRYDDFTRPYYALRRGQPGAEIEFAEALVALDTSLAQNPYLTGPAFGLADVAYVPWVIRARDLLGVSMTDTAHVDAWLARLVERPSVAAEVAVVAGLPAR
jgi:glutathione S-transferase